MNGRDFRPSSTTMKRLLTSPTRPTKNPNTNITITISVTKKSVCMTKTGQSKRHKPSKHPILTITFLKFFLLLDNLDKGHTLKHQN
jgi:hypothetical protein